MTRRKLYESEAELVENGDPHRIVSPTLAIDLMIWTFEDRTLVCEVGIKTERSYAFDEVLSEEEVIAAFFATRGRS